ncbi:HSF-type DNA-binding-domain-containing protein [Cunninghamella echinulata]|nr:HSF-type DNA-binding-domain-containing protein [Cunninghamella echinulata]
MAGPSNNKKAGGKINSKSNDGAVPEFIQKLFRMLENTAFQNTFCWSPDGTTFVVKDTNEFSKSILPKHFKHCNFASFVRQLNKYDFHKVRNSDDGSRPFGDQAWEFVHPKFKRDRKDLLEEIRRKTPGKSKKDESNTFTKENNNKSTSASSTSSSATIATEMIKNNQKQQASNLQLEDMKHTTQQLQNQINELQQYRIELEKRLQQLSNANFTIIQELAGLGKNMETKDRLIHDFFSKQIGINQDLPEEKSKLEMNELLNSFLNISKQNSIQLDRITHRLQNQWNGDDSDIKVEEETIVDTSTSSIQQSSALSNDCSLSQRLETPSNASTIPPTIPSQQTTESFNIPVSVAAAAASMNAGSLIGSPLKTADGLTFVTLGRLCSNTTLRDNKPAIEITAADQQLSSISTETQILSQQQDMNLTNITSASAISSSSQQQSTASTSSIISDNQNGAVSLKRKMNIAGWTVPPRVLLVDDDSVYRDLSGKLLQVIGCSIDLAKDGVEALRKMGLEKYDLILMDIVMPNLDGISATRNIRQYDALTPIISMTSNFTDNDIMQYIGSGMTDILPKPFSKKTLYSMLEKYCAHLKAIQRVHRVQDQNIPPTLGTLSLPAPASSSSSSTPPSILQHNNMNSDNSNTNNDNNNNNSGNNNSACNDINNQNTNTKNNSSNEVNKLSSQKQQQHFQSQASSSTTSAPNLTQGFPMSSYPYPITMNAVSIDSSQSSYTNSIPPSHQLPMNGTSSITNLTLWPSIDKQSIHTTSSPSHPPMIAPAIVPSNDGKFTWSLPTSNPIEMNNKRRRLNNED